MNLRIGGILLLAGSMFAFANAPLPIPGGLGSYKSITVAPNNGVGTSLGGGAFNATVAGVAQQTNFWCVDYQLHFSPTQTGRANIILIEDVGATANTVQYDNVTNAGSPKWTNTTLDTTAKVRYQMAAYLVTQYDYSSPTNLQSGLAGGAKNNNIQAAIWEIMSNTSVSSGQTSGNVNAAPWIADAVAKYSTAIDPTQWAVVSWGANADGSLSSTERYQTFIAQVVPEPGFYGLLSLGLGGLFLAVNRRKKTAQS